MDKTLREIEVKVADVLWVFGRRGFTDTETVEDSTRKIMYQVQELVKEAIPEEVGEIIDLDKGSAGVEEFCGRCGDLYKCTCKGYNQAIEEISKALRERGLL